MNSSLQALAAAVREQAPGRRRGYAVSSFATAVAARVHGSVIFAEESGSKVPGIRIQRPDEEVPWVVELVVWRHGGLAASLPGRVTDQIGSTVRLRRDYPGGALLSLLIVVVGEPDLRPRLDYEQLTRLGEVSPSRGFDRVVVGAVGATDEWRRLEGSSFVPLASFDDAMESLASAQIPAVPPAQPRASAEPQRPPRFLLAASEWHSLRGGLSTFNRELAIALSAAGIRVDVAVPSATEAERDSARAAGVGLAVPVPIPGINGLPSLLTKPQFADPEYRPDVIVGHGRITGPYAYALQNLHFPEAKRLHIVHTDAERLESAKEAPGGDSRMASADERNRVEIELAASATLAAGVGPMLAESIADRTRLYRAKSTPEPIELLPGLRESKRVDPRSWPKRRQVLLIARAEDVRAKGIDFAITAVKAAMPMLGSRPEERPVLVVRGLPLEHDRKERRRLRELAAPAVEMHFRPFTGSEHDLLADLWESRVVIMPSRHEGFGLAGYEAIAVGVPVLISQESGLALMLHRKVRDEEYQQPREIVPVSDDEKDVALWAEALHRVLSEPKASFKRAAELRDQLLEQISWPRTVAELIKHLGVEVPA